MALKNLVPVLSRGKSRLPGRAERYEPMREFRREVNRLFDEFFSDFPLAAGWEGSGLAPASFSPRVDVAETDKEVRVSAELPGLDMKDVSLEVEDDALTIRGERREEKEEKGTNWYRREQAFGSFHRVIPLPADVDGDKAKAKFKGGLLTVTVPKRPEAQSHRKAIEIESD